MLSAQKFLVTNLARLFKASKMVRNIVPSMPELSDTEMAALRFMIREPIRIDPFSRVPNVEEVAAMLDRLARMGLCRRTLEGLNREYSITPEGAEIVKTAS
jgi:hypothetical protein